MVFNVYVVCLSQTRIRHEYGNPKSVSVLLRRNLH